MTVRRHPATRRQSPRTVAHEFALSWLGCLSHQSCARIRGVLPTYTALVEPRLASTPLTHSDLATDPRVVSLALTYNCGLEAVASIRYTAGAHLLELHPNLLLVPGSWKGVAVPELPMQIPLPCPLAGGERLC